MDNLSNQTVKPTSGVAVDLRVRLSFFESLQRLTTKIHAANNVDEIMLDLALELCQIFGAERLTIYITSEDKTSILSKVKTGLNSGFNDIKLPINENSVAGFVAKTRKTVNINDVYDNSELNRVYPGLNFLQEVDRRTGYRTKEVLSGPIVGTGGDLLGVVQLINSRNGHAFGGLHVEGLKLLTDTLSVALMSKLNTGGGAKNKRRYDGLINSGLITEVQLDEIGKNARKIGHQLDVEILTHFPKIKLCDLGKTLSSFFAVEYESYEKRQKLQIPEGLKNRLRREYLEESGWLPLGVADYGMVIVCIDPEQVKKTGAARAIFGKQALIYRVTTSIEMPKFLDDFFGKNLSGLISSPATKSFSEIITTSQGAEDEDNQDVENVSVEASDNEMVQLVNKIIIDAYSQGASDIHIEPGGQGERVVIRYRIDGCLKIVTELPSQVKKAIVARIKIMSDLDISEKRKPQDGKIKFKKFGPLNIELRVATLPTATGSEDVVLRILAAGEPIPLEKLGLLDDVKSNLEKALSNPYGLFFVCGPTGSGKTTTLHSALNFLNTPETKIWTAEDPVEITQKGLRQIQINKKAGLDFATIMRAFLRADPDVIMVGEMRDSETTSIGIEASLTGHLVLATLHTNSAPESITRLLDMGMDPFNFADALIGILAQRLSKKLCVCAKQREASSEEIQVLLNEYCQELLKSNWFKKDEVNFKQKIITKWINNYGVENKLMIKDPVGCELCSGSGYKGRIGIHELMIGSDTIKSMIQQKAKTSDLLLTALEEGMLTLKQDGIEKCLKGLTDLKQIRAVCVK